MKTAQDLLKHVSVSEKPWSSYKASDYTPEQWHAACLIHQHDGDPTSKDQCKLPVKTPDGALNRNGVHSAAAALAGSRGGVNASVDEKQKAANALLRHYKTLGEEPPKSLTHSNLVEEILSHHGVKGMHWGSRRGKGTSGKASSDAKRSEATLEKRKQGGTRSLTNHEITQLTKRLQMEQSLHNVLPKKKSKVDSGHKFVKKSLELGATAGAVYAFTKTPVGKGIKDILVKSPSGKHFAK